MLKLYFVMFLKIKNLPSFAIVEKERREIMLKTQLILKKIEEVRTLMYDLMSEKQKLTDKELVELSQKLDKLLNEYDELVNSRK